METWNEDDSGLYRRLAAIAVPDRDTQLATMLTLLPLPDNAPSRVVDLGCGTGALSFAILETFPESHVTVLDGSESMLRYARENLQSFQERVLAESFELASHDWYRHLEGATAVVSSLAIHHLSGKDKRELFAQVARSLAEGGGFLIADIVAPQRAEQRELYAATWDLSAARQAERSGEDALYHLFRQEKWNIFTYPDPVDQPSTIVDQLRWLSEAGLEAVDCFWLSAGHAVYGGYRGTPRRPSPVRYSAAFAAARRALSKTSR